MKNNKFLVRILCMAYNHEPYITDTMAGFVMQNTSFPFVAVIIDDASTDKTSERIDQFLSVYFSLEDSSISRSEEKSFGQLVFAQHRTNKNCYFAVIQLKENHLQNKKSKSGYYQEWRDSRYIAICEGDDYWTDPLKLQKQVDFLETHPDFAICSHNYTRFFQDSLSFEEYTYYSDLFSDEFSDSYIEYNLDTYFDRWWTQPLTCMYRNGDYLKRIPQDSYPYFRDDIFYYYVLKEGKGALLKDPMGIYRVHSGGIWSGKSLIQQYDRASYNAYNIYLVEGDARSLTRVDREEFRALSALFNQHSFGAVIKRLHLLKKKVPRDHFRRVLRDFRLWLRNKIDRKVRQVFHF